MRQPFTKEQADAIKVMLAPLEGSVRELVDMIGPLNDRMAALENQQSDEPERELVPIPIEDAQAGDYIGDQGYWVGSVDPEVGAVIAYSLTWEQFQIAVEKGGLRGYRD